MKPPCVFRRSACGIALLAILPCAAVPSLEIHRSSGPTIELRWPAADVGFALEAAETLAAPAGWQAVGGAPVLANGMNSVTLPLGTVTRFFRLRSTFVPLTTIASSLPANWETGVALDRATSLRFSGLVYDENPLSEEKIYAEHNGVRLPAIVEIVDDGLPVTTVTLTYLADLPAGALIRVTVNGSLLRDDRDRLVDADGNGSPGGVRVLEFETADNRPPDGDGDGVDDLAEATLGTDPARWDSDDDGFSDGQERAAATDPLALDSRPGIRLPDGPSTVGELMASFPTFGPFAVDPDVIPANGQVPGRIEAMLNPQSTPAIVNAALDAAGLRIVTLRPGLLFVTLALPPRPGAAYTPAEVAAIAQPLVENSDLTPFLLADPAYAPRPKVFPGAPDSAAAVGLRPQDRIRLPAAWNLLAKPPPAPARPVRVLVPDYYHWTVRHPQIWVQRFVPSLGWTTPGASGNHGFAVASAIAASFDDALPTGAYPTANPQPRDYLEVLSLPIDGLSTLDSQLVIVDAIKLHQPDIVSTSVGYVADVPPNATRSRRIMDAYRWRQLVLTSGQSFLHVTAAGNDFDDSRTLAGYERLAEFDADWNLAGRRGNLDDMLQGATELTPAEINRLGNAVAALPANLPGLFEPLNNVVIVGSLEANGSRSTFSEFGEDALVQGSDLTLACAPAFAGDNCISSGRSGTSYAAPQVAGVAAYLLTQKPGLTLAQLRDALLHTRAGDVLDAYRAVLELDAGGYEQPLRRRLLDVAGGEEADASGAKPDGKFDEQDLEAFVNAFRDAEALRAPGDPPDRSRFDLNGDGFTGGSSTATFDLDYTLGEIGSSVLSTLSREIRNVPVEFDETALTDLQILCFYAYSMYTGSPRERGRILGAGCCPLPPMLAFNFAHGDGSRGGIQIISATTGAVGYFKDYVPLPNQSALVFGAPAWKPDGSELAFKAPGSTDYDLDISVVRVGGELAEVAPSAQLTSGSDKDYRPVYLAQELPNRETFFFMREFAIGGNRELFVGKDPGFGPPRQLTANGLSIFAVEFPLNGSVSANNELVFSYYEGQDGYSLRTINPVNGFQRTLTPVVGAVPAAYWSPDGASVAWSIAGRVQLVTVATREVRTLATAQIGSADLSWSPDGRRLVYVSDDVGGGQIGLSIVDLQGNPPVPLMPGGMRPAWSADGEEIAFVRGGDVWVRTLETGVERQLTSTPMILEDFPVWRPGSATAP